MKDFGFKLRIYILRPFLTHPHPEADTDDVHHFNSVLPYANSIQVWALF